MAVVSRMGVLLPVVVVTAEAGGQLVGQPVRQLVADLAGDGLALVDGDPRGAPDNVSSLGPHGFGGTLDLRVGADGVGGADDLLVPLPARAGPEEVASRETGQEAGSIAHVGSRS